MSNIQHVWFDFSDTIAKLEKPVFERFIYGLYGELAGKEVTPELIEDYKKLLAEKKSNAAVFKSLGVSGQELSDRAAELKDMYSLTDPHIPGVIQTIRERMPVSIFSNSRLDVVLPALGLEAAWFTHLLGPDRVKEPKPALEGFQKMIELSGTPAEDILYIGDDVEKDIAPAKAVGMQAGLLWQESDVADYSFKDFSEISELFG